jgi:phage portal protein BeeE
VRRFSYQLQKIAYTLLFCAVEQISNDIAKIPFSVKKNGNNRESKPNHPAHKLVSFLLTA